MNQFIKKFSIITITFHCVTACGNSPAKKDNDYLEAKISAKNDANRLISAQKDSIEMQTILLEIRSKEHDLRSNIDDSAANLYIHTFESVISEENDSIARLIF